MFEILLHWVIKYDISDLNMMKHLGGERVMKNDSHVFVKNSGGMLIDTIGALDG